MVVTGSAAKGGLHTFIDPRQQGGALNSISPEKVDELVVSAYLWVWFMNHIKEITGAV